LSSFKNLKLPYSGATLLVPWET